MKRILIVSLVGCLFGANQLFGSLVEFNKLARQGAGNKDRLLTIYSQLTLKEKLAAQPTLRRLGIDWTAAPTRQAPTVPVVPATRRAAPPVPPQSTIDATNAFMKLSQNFQAGGMSIEEMNDSLSELLDRYPNYEELGLKPTAIAMGKILEAKRAGRPLPPLPVKGQISDLLKEPTPENIVKARQILATASISDQEKQKLAHDIDQIDITVFVTNVDNAKTAADQQAILDTFSAEHTDKSAALLQAEKQAQEIIHQTLANEAKAKEIAAAQQKQQTTTTPQQKKQQEQKVSKEEKQKEAKAQAGSAIVGEFRALTTQDALNKKIEELTLAGTALSAIEAAAVKAHINGLTTLTADDKTALLTGLQAIER